MEQQMSDKVEDIRHELALLMRKLSDLDLNGQTDYIDGLLRGGMVCLHGVAEENRKWEVNRKGGVKVGNRGIGLDTIKKCFACGCDTSGGFTPNISMFVKTKEEGQTVVDMFPITDSARLDYREREPNWIQVKAGSCPECEDNLQHLSDLINNVPSITEQDVIAARELGMTNEYE